MTEKQEQKYPMSLTLYGTELPSPVGWYASHRTKTTHLRHVEFATNNKKECLNVYKTEIQSKCIAQYQKHNKPHSKAHMKHN